MFIVITGLDGSGTTSIAKALVNMDKKSDWIQCPAKEVYSEREAMDKKLTAVSPFAHMLYYLSADAYTSDYIIKNYDYKNNNIYCVRYLIDTVVSNRAAGYDIKLDYNLLSFQLLKPDLTLFVHTDEDVRQSRITKRGKSFLDLRLDDANYRNAFKTEFKRHLDAKSTICVNNNAKMDEVALRTYNEIVYFATTKQLSFVAKQNFERVFGE